MILPIAYTTWGVAVGSQDVTGVAQFKNAAVATHTGPEQFPTALSMSCYSQAGCMAYVMIGK